MMAKMRMGPKGQVVIPKMFRDDLGLKPGASVVMDYNKNKLVISKAASDFVELAESIAKSSPKVKLTMEDIRKGYFQQLDERHARIHRQ
ncbi:AbrB/MazE/SpoVT family DNA-binding domain-containing protein [Candidatus Woesearchaeota archaeon]|nr:AbrB/MazE/SpoVT family DNA-binding domain-containing protein [Candidatus Woesearchaeota archaeon]